jgi:hypothetical protein
VDLGAVLLDLILVLGDEAFPALGGELGHAVEPARIELRALVILEEVLARDAVAVDQRVDSRLRRSDFTFELLTQSLEAFGNLVEPALSPRRIAAMPSWRAIHLRLQNATVVPGP